MPRFELLAFDADDTLWHNERLYIDAQTQLKALLAQYHTPEWIEQRLFDREMHNLQHFGYGIKAFALSMIETAVELTEGRITGREVQQIIDVAKSMLAAEVQLLDHVAATLDHLAQRYTLMLLTKGDLRDQEDKLARSGLAQHFDHVEIVSDKRAASYQRVLERHKLAPEHFVMVGNSLRSDILPVLALGAHAVYVPYPLTWAHEAAALPAQDQPGFHQIDHLGALPELLARLETCI